MHGTETTYLQKPDNFVVGKHENMFLAGRSIKCCESDGASYQGASDTDDDALYIDICSNCVVQDALREGGKERVN